MCVNITDTIKVGAGADGLVGGLVVVMRLVVDALEDVWVEPMVLPALEDAPVVTVTGATSSVRVGTDTSVVMVGVTEEIIVLLMGDLVELGVTVPVNVEFICLEK